MYEEQDNGTGGSLAEQMRNHRMDIVSKRNASNGGGEVNSIASKKIIAWSPRRQAVLELVRQALEANGDPGGEAEVTQVQDWLGDRALLTRAALRDQKVVPLVEPAKRDIDELVAKGVAGITVQNAQQACKTFVARTFDRVRLLEDKISSTLEAELAVSKLLERIKEATIQSSGRLATLEVACGRLLEQARQEPERIDREIAASAAAEQNSRQEMRVVAKQLNQTGRLFQKRVLGRLVHEVSVQIPKLTRELLSQLYLPELREHLPTIQHALEDWQERLSERRQALSGALREFQVLVAEQERREKESGRIRVIGAPATRAEQEAAVEALVDQVRPTLSAKLRRIIVWEAAPRPKQILNKLIAAAEEQVLEAARETSIDQVLLKNQGPFEAAQELADVIQSVKIPLGLRAGTDHGRLRTLRPMVIQIPKGSKLIEALVEHAGFNRQDFAESSQSDRIKIIIYQMGINLRDTRILESGGHEYNKEVGASETPPLVTFSDGTLQAMS